MQAVAYGSSVTGVLSDICCLFALQIRILDHHTWPVDVTSPWQEGERKLRGLCERLNVDFQQSVEGFRDFIDSAGNGSVPSALQPLQIAVDTIPVTSADAERGFSSMNIICTSIRNSLTICHLSQLMFISLVGPELPDFDPTSYVRSWLAKGHRHAEDNRSRKCEPSRDEADRYGHLAVLFK